MAWGAALVVQRCTVVCVVHVLHVCVLDNPFFFCEGDVLVGVHGVRGRACAFVMLVERASARSFRVEVVCHCGCAAARPIVYRDGVCARSRTHADVSGCHLWPGLYWCMTARPRVRAPLS